MGRTAVGNTDSYSGGQAMLSISLTQFSVDGGAVFPPCSLACGQGIVGVMVIMAIFKRTYASS